MSLKNRFLKNGIYTIKHENRFQTFLGKIACLFRGHKIAKIEAKTGTFQVCISCWKKFGKEIKKDANI